MVESMDEAKVKEIKSMIRAVIQSSKEGVLSKRFNREYHGITGQNVPYKELGFQSLDSYLKSIPDIVAIKVNRDGEKVYFAVADDSTAHLAKMISKQRSARKRNIIKVKPFRRPTFPTPRRSSSRTFSSRYGPMATPRSSYTSSSSPAPPKLRSVIYVPPMTTFRPMIRSDLSVKPSTSNTSLKFGSSYEVPPRFKKKQQEPPAGSKRKDSSSSFSTVSENSTEDQRTSLPDPKVEKMLKGVKDYKSLLHIYCSKKKGSLKAIYTSFQSPTFHWVSSVDIDGNRFTSSESANSKKEAEHFAAKAAIRGLFEDISTLINFEKYKNTDKVENEDTAEPAEQKMKSPNTDDDESLAQNVKELMQSKPNGLWSTRFRFEYKNKFSEDPPQDILEKMQDWKDVVSMERFQDKIILYPVKEKPKKTTAEDQSPDNQKNKTESGNLNGESSKYDLQIKTIISPTTGEMRRSVTDRSSVSDDISGKEEPKLKIDKLQIKAAENPPIRSSWKGYVSHIENCSEFYIHRSNCSINDIMDLISEKYSSSEASPAVVSGYGKGDYCVAFYARDKCWCRAVILDHRKKAQQRLYTHPHQTEDTASQNGVDEYHVQYIDFGNKEKVPAYHVRLLSLECAKHPAQALRCQLHGMAISDVSSADTMKKFKDLTEDELTFQVIEHKDNAYSVELTTESGVNINKLLCRQGIGVAPPALVYPAGKYWDVFVSYVGSVNDVSLILVGPEYSDKLDNLEDAMLKYYTEHTESFCDVKTGEVYSFMSEDAHYRVKVLEINQQEALVEYMDHGDSENVEISQLNSLPTQFRELPFQAITCGLASLEQFGQNDKVLNKLIDMALGKVLVAEIVNR
ncbi:tudor domain-containing protein 7-like [Ptychodera flava]|uniref:tudor domain-containing protein 7-like n=1 Tax=Ptychodera flava TaxID=63121 RepID=UPI00396A7BC6